MSEYKVVSVRPIPRLTKEKSHDEYADEVECVKALHIIGISKVKSISSRSRKISNYARLDGPGYLKLWKEYERQK